MFALDVIPQIFILERFEGGVVDETVEIDDAMM